MTVPSDTSSVSYDGNGSTQIFSVPFYFLDDTHLVVQTATAGVATTKTLNTDYTVSGAGNEAGGDITMLSAPAVGTKVYIYRQVPLTQLNAYVENTPFPAATQEKALDQLTMAAQQLYLAIQGALRLSAVSTIDGVSGVLPEPAANEALGWNATVNGFQNISIPDAGTGTYVPGFTGAVASRLIADKLRESVSVLDFGADKTGVADSTAAINAAVSAVSAAGGEVFFPRGTYLVTGEIVVSSQSISLVGESKFGCLIKQATANAKILNVTGAYFCLRNLSFIYSGTPVAGATAIYSSSTYGNFADFMIRSAYTGVHVTTGAGQKFRAFEILDYVGSGFEAQAVNDVYVSQFILNAGNNTNGALGGIRLLDKVEAFVCSDGDVLLGVRSLATSASSYTVGNRPAYCAFTNVFFDSDAQGASVANMVESEFVGCWFSGGRTAAGYPGCTIATSEGVRFTNTRFFNCGSAGMSHAADAVRVSYVNCSFESNSVTAGSGTSHGLLLANNAADFNVIGCKASNSLYPGGQQGYGIFVSNGCDRFNIVGNLLTGNATGALLDGSSATAKKRITGNPGFVSRASGSGAIPVGQTITTVSHGLSGTPAIGDITITSSSNLATHGVTNLYVTNITSTQFTVGTNAAVTTSDAPFGWSARLAGG